MKLTTKQIKILEEVFSLAKDYQQVLINPGTGKIRFTWRDNSGKNKSSNAGDLFKIEEIVLPISSYIPASRNAKKSFYGMDKLPKAEKESNDISWARFGFEFEIMVNPEIMNQQNYVEADFGTYRVINGKEFSGFFNKSGRLVYIESRGAKYYVAPDYEPLHTTFMIKCETCKEIFLPDKIDLYVYDHDKTGHFCRDCKPEGSKRLEIK